jgi:hypothetical protein
MPIFKNVLKTFYSSKMGRICIFILNMNWVPWIESFQGNRLAEVALPLGKPRSPDITRLDSFFRGHVNDVYLPPLPDNLLERHDLLQQHLHPQAYKRVDCT